MNPRRRVAITGVGMVTPVGSDAPTSWASLLAGRSGVGPIRQFDARGFPVRIGAEVKDFAPEEAICEPKLLKFASRSHRFALAAAGEALTDSGIRPSAGNGHRWGLSVGAGMLGVTFSELQSVHAFCAPAAEIFKG
jgi:3-oxoacyl-[acyl-carrier-protein] synthase II